MKVIIETIDSKDVRKYIHEISEPNGHDCWGNTEWSSYDVVYVNSKAYTLHKESYIAHDGEKPLHVGFIDHLPDGISTYLDPTLIEKYKKEKYERYLELQKEFSIESDENKKIKREVTIENIVK